MVMLLSRVGIGGTAFLKSIIAYMWPTDTVDESQDEDTPDHGW